MTTETTTDLLLWIDVETTGLDPTVGDLLEVGMILTTMQGDPIDATEHVIRHDPDIIKTAIDNDNTTAIAMHFRNQLLQESLLPDSQAASLAATANAINRKLDEWLTQGTLHPAGTNVDFDLQWLTLKLPYCTRLQDLNHRKLDLTTLRLAAIAQGRDPYRHGHDTIHHVHDCLSRDLNEYRYWLRDHE
ncbi:hypothetical protein [Bifidobacterium phasiani]|uniref:Uncharacterized protein n=1 Tax=Bifidobacterium phasiani TaxID=2834431 RepID=A0ABS6W661_9BIFI|nr:hypothetical protein [Bifidobacterium phasiani]MBW3081986.1 hypothetical protein [Bifidobacterium phasiani]